MELIIGIILLIVYGIAFMMLMTVVYHFFYGVMPFIAIIMIVVGVIVGFCNATKNTINVFKEVYGKNRGGIND